MGYVTGGWAVLVLGMKQILANASVIERPALRARRVLIYLMLVIYLRYNPDFRRGDMVRKAIFVI